jgi:hypothetical protein
MIFKPSNPSGTSRRAVAALLLSVALALTCVAPSHARTGVRGSTVKGAEQTAPQGLVHFLLRIFGCAGGTMDPNGLLQRIFDSAGGTMDPNGQR